LKCDGSIRPEELCRVCWLCCLMTPVQCGSSSSSSGSLLGY
jgi:hypothetical protein